MTTLSSIVAIASGVLGDALVSRFDGARVWPFLAAALSAAAAAVLILKTWPENYGTSNSREGAGQTTSLADMRSGIRTILGDKRIWGLGLTSTFFEGTMYLFVFFWSAALKSPRTKAGSDEELPFGLIFSSFMCAMMAGSALFSLATPTPTKESSSGMLMMTVLATSCCLSAAVLLENEQVLFWTLCVVEMCIGAYFPSMSYLKSEVVEDGVRGRVYSILRLPLNLFVVVAHSLDQEGDGHRNHELETVLHVYTPSLEDAQAFKAIAGAVGRRAARLSAVAIAGIVLQSGKLDDPEAEYIDIGVDGSLVEHYPFFRDMIYEALRAVNGIGSKGAEKIRIGIAKDGSGVGAALIALVAAGMEKETSDVADFRDSVKRELDSIPTLADDSLTSNQQVAIGAGIVGAAAVAALYWARRRNYI
ncbi:hypothetical protein BN1708_016769 [Verticillium longisporum]|uniref:Molybdate-anion transporter n=1 Tax=Verticillium longisporum TaxID=100787 RepID=A0A0G4N0S0_VERLO|nr:hypothetical protein BN1708_016769 [Verticillium longisporum]